MGMRQTNQIKNNLMILIEIPQKYSKCTLEHQQTTAP
jgi:hypothetical protein